MSSSDVGDMCALHTSPLLGQRSIDEQLSAGKQCDVFCCSSKMSLGSDLNITIPRHWAALCRDANGSPVFHFDDAELASLD